MRTYSNVLEELCQLLDDAVNLAEENESPEQMLSHLNVKALKRLSVDSELHGDASLTKKLTSLLVFSDETGKRRRDILSTPNPKYQKGTFNTTARDILGSFCVQSAISFLFVNEHKKFIHCYFIVDNESQKLNSVSFNETIYNENDPEMIGSINLINNLERGYNSLTDYK